mgnify:CR=1 FL=1
MARSTAAVITNATGASDSLLPRVRREHAENHGDAGIETHLLQAASGFSGDVIEVWCIAANHRAKRDNRAEFAARR